MKRHNSRFLDRYFESGVYPEGRAVCVLFKLIDLKLQLYYLLESGLGIYNSLYFEPMAQLGRNDDDPSPRCCNDDYCIIRSKSHKQVADPLGAADELHLLPLHRKRARNKK